MPGTGPGKAIDRDPPTIVLGLSACVVWAACAWFSGGFGSGSVAVEGATLILLLGLGLTAGRAGLVEPTGSRTVALAALGGFVIWTGASIAWAHVRAEAWIGTEKALVYAVGFLLFALFRYSPQSLERILDAYVAALAAVAGAVIVRALDSPHSSFVEGRLQAPTGYINATVALWMLGFWPACHVMARRESHPLARAGAAAAATSFAALSVLGQSRSWLFISVAIACLFLIVSPSRLRLLPVFAIVTAAIASAWSSLLAVFSKAPSGVVSRSAALSGFRALALAALLAAVLTTAWAAVDRRGAPPRHVTRAALWALGALAVIGVAAVAVRYRDHLRHPYAWARSEWRSFAQVEMIGARRTRFLAPLGSDRYQEWRIAWSAFREQPLKGIGAENFGDVYLLHRRDSLHEPSFPHSIPLGVLSQLGLVGASLFGAFAAGAVVTARGRLRGAAGGAAAAALMVPAYWLAHGAFDWFWEFPALAGPAIGFLGLVAAPPHDSVAPRSRADGPRRALLKVLAAGAAALLATAALLALAVTALADAYTSSAAADWRRDPGRSYRMLDLAARLDPLSAEALVISGSIALARREYTRARRVLLEATGREPRNWYAWFQLGLCDAARARWAAARPEITRARRLNPRDPVVLLADSLIRTRRPFSGAALNALYLNELRTRFHLAAGGS